ncbi:MAG TPA: EamA family transporter [Methylomirabilota bacterium]|nr:EamA family transporter [Methylomirabilota bacterium]
MPWSPHVFLALGSALFSAAASLLIQQGLRRSNFYAAFWINVAVGVVGLWSAVLLLIPPATWNWRTAHYFLASGLIGTAGGRLFRVLAIDKVGAPVATSILNMTPLFATVFAVAILGERVTLPIMAGTLVIVAGTVLLSLSGKYVGFPPRHLIYPLLGASCFGAVQVIRKLGLSPTGPVFDAAINTSAGLIAATAFVLATGNWGALRCDRRSLLYLIGGGVAENTGVFLLIVALGFGDVSVVTPLIGTAPLFVLALTSVLPGARRPMGWRVVTGSVLVVLGVFLLTGVGRR